ncbi:MAG: hypothetical protein IPM36_09610 [Lewinellaceae bacterium]|nr:hypothetical protein [Lewinellaceae bacterium]
MRSIFFCTALSPEFFLGGRAVWLLLVTRLGKDDIPENDEVKGALRIFGFSFSGVQSCGKPKNKKNSQHRNQKNYQKIFKMKEFIFLQAPSTGRMIGRFVGYYILGNFIMYLILWAIKGSKEEAWRMITTKFLASNYCIYFGCNNCKYERCY